MYIDPFWLGVLSVLGLEFVALTIIAIFKR